MAYVDLNPVRAGMEESLDTSDFTSIQQRLAEFASKKRQLKKHPELAERTEKQVRLKADLKLDKQPEAPLMVFDGSNHTDIHVALPFSEQDYLRLVDETGRVLRVDKRGAIPDTIKPIIQRFGIDPKNWLEHVQNFSRRYGRCAGHVVRMRAYVERYGLRAAKGVGSSKVAYRVA